MTPAKFIETCNDAALEILLTEMVKRGFGIPTLDAIKNNRIKRIDRDKVKILVLN